MMMHHSQKVHGSMAEADEILFYEYLTLVVNSCQKIANGC